MYQVLSIEQTEIYTTGDSTTHVRAYLVCDAVSDLPGISDIPGYTLEMGSRALVIQDAAKYCMQSDGTWMLQVTADVQSIITQLSDIDDRLQDTTADASWAKSQVNDYIYPALRAVINRGAKNALNLLPAVTDTVNGITFTVNDDCSITMTGTASATAFFSVPVVIPAGSYWYSGMPEDGSSSTYRLELRLTPAGSVSSTCDTAEGVAFVRNSDYSGYFSIRVASGYTFTEPKTVKPMMAPQILQTITSDYVPYSPTNAEIAKLIHGYHP